MSHFFVIFWDTYPNTSLWPTYPCPILFYLQLHTQNRTSSWKTCLPYDVSLNLIWINYSFKIISIIHAKIWYNVFNLALDFWISKFTEYLCTIVHTIISFFLINQGLAKSDVPFAWSYLPTLSHFVLFCLRYLPTQKSDVLYERSPIRRNQLYQIHFRTTNRVSYKSWGL